MGADWFSSMLQDVDPADIAFRYLSHASIRRHGLSEKLEGAALKRFVARAPEFKDVEDYDFAINWATFLMDTEDEWSYIKRRVTDITLKSRKP
jgi:hypothetical protein